MGYCMRQKLDGMFFIPQESINDAYQAIKSLKGQETVKDSRGRHFYWVDYNFDKLPTFDAIMKAWRWSPEYDSAGNVTRLSFTGEKSGDDLVLFNAIAPFVQDGSYIEMLGEDGDRWRWIFQDNKCEEKHARIEWD